MYLAPVETLKTGGRVMCGTGVRSERKTRGDMHEKPARLHKPSLDTRRIDAIYRIANKVPVRNIFTNTKIREHM